MSDNRPITEISKEVIEISHWLWTKGFVANHEGNITVRLPADRILSTPTAMSKGDLTVNDLIVLDKYGRKIRGTRRPFSELSMHLSIYEHRRDVNAVIHAHPPYSTAFALAGKELDGRFEPEFAVSMGERIPLVPFAVPGTDALVNKIVEFVEDYDCILLENHGVMCWGTTLNQARLRIEHCENYAQHLFLASFIGPVKRLPDTALAILADKRRKAGLGPDGRKSV